MMGKRPPNDPDSGPKFNPDQACGNYILVTDQFSLLDVGIRLMVHKMLVDEMEELVPEEYRGRVNHTTITLGGAAWLWWVYRPGEVSDE